jgi:hypothetical protein
MGRHKGAKTRTPDEDAEHRWRRLHDAGKLETGLIVRGPPWLDATRLCGAAVDIYVNGMDFTTLSSSERKTVCERAVYACVRTPMQDTFEVERLAAAIRTAKHNTAWTRDLLAKLRAAYPSAKIPPV